MRFKLVKTGRCYAEHQGGPTTLEALVVPELQEGAFGTRAEVVSQVVGEGSVVPPVIWETGNIDQIRALLVLREAELVLARAQLTGNDRIDWWANNRILDLEKKIADLRRWLADAPREKNEQ